MRLVKRSLLTIWILLLILALVACDGAEETPGTEVAPLATDVADIGDEEPDLETTPMVTEEVDIEPTDVMTDVATMEPTEEVMATEEMTPTVEVVATEEMTPTVEAEATAVMTETETITDTDTMTTTVTQAILASDLVGMDITNDEGDEVGEVGELLIDEDGTVQYVVFDVGGFLGIGEKSVAVTWDEMEIQLEDGVEPPAADEEISPDDFTVKYTGVAADLEALPDFDISILDENGYVVDEDMDTADDFDATPYTGLVEVGEFQDYNLMNSAGEDVGEVEDLVVDLSEGQVNYTVVDFGGFLGAGETTVAVPWDQLELDATDEDETFMLDVAQPDLEEAPVFDFDAWTYPVEPDWDADGTRTFWETQ